MTHSSKKRRSPIDEEPGAMLKFYEAARAAEGIVEPVDIPEITLEVKLDNGIEDITLPLNQRPSEYDIKKFCAILLEIQWLPPQLHLAIKEIIAGSVNKFNRRAGDALACFYSCEIDRRKAELREMGWGRKKGKDIHQRALADVAHLHHMTADALRQHLRRHAAAIARDKPSLSAIFARVRPD